MATTIIRPDEILSSTGFDTSGTTLLGRINDDDSSTFSIQSNVSSQIVCTFDDGAYSGTINSITLSIIGSTSARSSATTITAKLQDSSGTTLQSSAHTISSGDGITQKDGDAYTDSLSVSLVDGLRAQITPDTNGCHINEVFITVDFTPADSGGGKITLTSGKITLTSGKITL